MDSASSEWQRLKIIGVMKDFNIESMHKAITPVCFTVNGGGGGDQFSVVRISGNDIPGTIRLRVTRLLKQQITILPMP